MRILPRPVAHPEFSCPILLFPLTMIHNLFDRVKLTLQKEKKFRKALYRIFGFYPHSLEIYRIALAHKSHVYRNRKGRSFNNERLEFLGDAILEAVVSDIVFHRYDKRPEGFLTSTRSKIVQRATLNRLAQDLGINALLQAPAQRRGHNSYIGGNAFEALMGAAYIDRGYACCKWFIAHRIIGKLLDLDGVANKEVNFKSKLLEWCQKNKIEAYYTHSETMDANSDSPVFESSIFIEAQKAGEGRGFSKKESQQKAAREALTRLRREPQFVDCIFRQKEKRTAMEAEPVCVLPKIDVIEAQLEQEEKVQDSDTGKGKRNASSDSGKTGSVHSRNSSRQTESKKDGDAAGNGTAGKKPKTRSDIAQPANNQENKAARTSRNTPAAVLETSQEKTETPVTSAAAAPSSKPRRRPKKPVADSISREATVSAAEEAAYAES